MKNAIFLFLVFIIIFIVGCKEDTPIEVDKPFIGGNKGLRINFQPGTPVSEFGQDDLVDVKVKVINEGEHEIPANTAKVKLFGVSPFEFNTLNLDDFKLVEKSLFPAEKDISNTGGEAIIDLGQIDYNGVISGFVDRELFSKFCYPYRTKANVEACITSKRAEELGASKICSHTGEKISSGFVSSGPIQVTTFTEELRGINQISFKIGFQNKGAGSVFDKNAECEDFETSFGRLQHKNKIYVELSPQNIECSFSGGLNYGGHITLDDGQEKILVCTLDVEEDSKYIQGIDIFVDYNYVDTTSTKIRVLGNQ